MRKLKERAEDRREKAARSDPGRTPVTRMKERDPYHLWTVIQAPRVPRSPFNKLLSHHLASLASLQFLGLALVSVTLVVASVHSSASTSPLLQLSPFSRTSSSDVRRKGRPRRSSRRKRKRAIRRELVGVLNLLSLVRVIPNAVIFT